MYLQLIHFIISKSYLHSFCRYEKRQQKYKKSMRRKAEWRITDTGAFAIKALHCRYLGAKPISPNSIVYSV